MGEALDLLVGAERLDDLRGVLRFEHVLRQSRGPNRSFYGWHWFEAGLVREVGGYTKEAPTVLNEWHAEVFPSEDSDDEIKQLCTAIISEAQFYQKTIPTID